MIPCTVESCGAEAKRGGLCWAHHKRKLKGRQLSPQIQERVDGRGPKARWARIEAAAVRFADAVEAPSSGDPMEDRSDYLREKHAFREALYRYFFDKNGEIQLVRRDTGAPAPVVKKRR